MDLAQIEAQLRELEDRYQEWSEPISLAIRQGLGMPGTDGPPVGDFREHVRQVRDRQLAKYDPYAEMNALFDALCPFYLAASDEERSRIRTAARDKRGILSALLGYVVRSAERLRSTSNAEWLRRGLAAASIESCCRDYRDAFLAWAELFLAAEEIGLDPRPAFREVASLSSDEKPPGSRQSFRRMLSGFHRSGALRERRQKEGERAGGS